MRISGKGEAGVNGGANGDIYFEINVMRDSFYERDHEDVYIHVPITVTEAILGCKKEVPTLYGNVMMDIKAGCQNGAKYKLKGKGLKVVNSSRCGDEYVVIDVMIPSKLSRTQKELIEELSGTDLEVNPEFKAFKKHL